MRHYLRNPELVVNTLFIFTSAMHWAGVRSIRPWNDESGTFLRAGAAIHAVLENKNEHDELELPARLKKITPRAAGYPAAKLFHSAAGNNNNLPPPFPLLFDIGAPHGIGFNPPLFRSTGLNPQFQNNARSRTAALKLNFAGAVHASTDHRWRYSAHDHNIFSPT